MGQRTSGGTIANAVIMAGLAFFGSLGGAALLGTPNAGMLALATGCIAAGEAFFIQLAAERGLLSKRGGP